MIDKSPTARFMVGLGDLSKCNSIYEARQPLTDDPLMAQDPANRNIYLKRNVIGVSTHQCTAEPGATVANNHRVSRHGQPLDGQLIPLTSSAQELIEQIMAGPTLSRPTPTNGVPQLRNGNGGFTWLCHDGTFCDEGDVWTLRVGAGDGDCLEVACAGWFLSFCTDEDGSTLFGDERDLRASGVGAGDGDCLEVACAGWFLSFCTDEDGSTLFGDERDLRASGVGAADVACPEAACARWLVVFRTDEDGWPGAPGTGGCSTARALADAVVGPASGLRVLGCDESVLLGWAGGTGPPGCGALASVGAALVGGAVAVATAERLGRGGSPGCSGCCNVVEVAEVG